MNNNSFTLKHVTLRSNRFLPLKKNVHVEFVYHMVCWFLILLANFFLSYSDSTFFMLRLRLYFVQFQLVVLIRIYDLPGSHSFCHFIQLQPVLPIILLSACPRHIVDEFLFVSMILELYCIVETNNYLKVDSFHIELLGFFCYSVFVPLGKSYVSNCVNIFTAIFSW